MFNLFRKYETNKQLKERLLKLCPDGNYGLCPPPLVADVAINELRDFFLGKDWYSSFAVGNEPTFSDIVYEIKTKYKPKKVVQHKQLPNANSAIMELQDFFLGKDWYVVLPISHDQVIAEIVYSIERKFRFLKAI